MRIPTLTAAALTAALAGATQANDFTSVTSEAEFVSLVSGKELRRFGIVLGVSPDGRISGRAFGKAVTGAWNWDGGFFCRELSFGTEVLAPNCQVVKVAGDRIRFIADQGRGDHADFGLRLP